MTEKEVIIENLIYEFKELFPEYIYINMFQEKCPEIYNAPDDYGIVVKNIPENQVGTFRTRITKDFLFPMAKNELDIPAIYTIQK